MNHGKAHRKFNRRSDHRRAMLANLAVSLIKHEQIVTTLPKAKDLRPVVEKLVTLGKRGGLHARRQAIAQMRDLAMVKKLFDVIGPRYKERSGGYTRVLKAGFRYGDYAPVAVIEFVDRDVEAKGKDSGPVQAARGTAGAARPPAAGAACGRRARRRDAAALLRPRSAAYIGTALIRGLSMPRSLSARAACLAASVRLRHGTVVRRQGAENARRRPRPPSCSSPSRRWSNGWRPRWSTSMPPHVVANNNPFLADPFFRQFFGAVPREQVERSLGSGVLVDPSGLVVTNYHVIEGASEVKVALADKREFDAEIVLKDQRSDLAVLRSRAPTSVSRRSNSPIPTRCRSATWCSPSAIRSASARP